MADQGIWVEKNALLREADFVVLLLPYSPAVHHYIGAAELGLMKPTASLKQQALRRDSDGSLAQPRIYDRARCWQGVDGV